MIVPLTTAAAFQRGAQLRQTASLPARAPSVAFSLTRCMHHRDAARRRAARARAKAGRRKQVCVGVRRRRRTRDTQVLGLRHRRAAWGCAAASPLRVSRSLRRRAAGSNTRVLLRGPTALTDQIVRTSHLTWGAGSTAHLPRGIDNPVPARRRRRSRAFSLSVPLHAARRPRARALGVATPREVRTARVCGAAAARGVHASRHPPSARMRTLPAE
jgi:hypothetical protein